MSRESHRYFDIPESRLATFDVYSVGRTKNHVAALLEIDVTKGRLNLSELKRKGEAVSFTAWIIKLISRAVEKHPEAASYVYSKKKSIIFEDIDISVLVEKKIGDKKLPLPLVVRSTNQKSVEDIHLEILNARKRVVSGKEFVINQKSALYERLYYRLPSSVREMIWRKMLRYPGYIHKKMGNVAVTSLSAAGIINGWFIHRSVHPLSFGIGSIIKKPVVLDDEIRIREMLNLTVLIDHNAIDGAHMMRFISYLKSLVEKGEI